MPAFARGGKRAVRIACKVYAERYKSVRHGYGTANHTLYRLTVVFAVSRAHRVVEITLVIFLAAQTADTALGKIAVAFIGRSLADYKHAFIFGQV